MEEVKKQEQEIEKNVEENALVDEKEDLKNETYTGYRR